MKKQATFIISVLYGFSIYAATVSDDFNRADTAFVSDADVAIAFGNNWENGSASLTANYRIFSNEVDIGTGGSGSTPYMLLQAGLNTYNVSNSFVISAQLKLDTLAGTGYAGLIFNYQNPTNYYAFRYSGAGAVQLLRVVNGSVGTALNVSGGFAHVQNRPYIITVASSEPYVFSVSIYDTVTATSAYTNSVTDGQNKFSNGSGGLYSTTGAATFDDFSLSSTDPNALTLFIVQ